MTSGSPASTHAVKPSHRAGGDDFSTAPTAAENTPLLQSPRSSNGTLRDGSADGHPDGAASGDLTEEPVLGWKRAVCIILSMWALIFLQGKALWTPCRSSGNHC